MIELISSLFKKKRTIRDRLEFIFKDSLGIKYYKFPDGMALPLERFGKLNEYMMYMTSSITSSELDTLLDEADKALTEGLTQKKNAAKIGFILNQIRQRKELVIHTELLYNFIAVQTVREDESPEHFNNQIHLEKIESFKEETRNRSTYDFFLNLGLKKLNGLYNMSEEEWTKYWEESLQQQLLLKKVAEIIQSKEQSLNTEKAIMST